MSLTLVVGPPNAGKTGVLHKVVREAVSAGTSAVVLLPSRPDVESVAAEFARRGPLLGVATTVFDSYVDTLWALHGDARSIVGSAERSILLGRALASSRLETLRPSSEGQGLLQLLLPLASDLFEPPTADLTESGVAGEIARVLAAYSDLLLTEERIERAAAVRHLERSKDHNWFAGPIVVNRFADLTATQERFLSTASAHADLWLSLPWQEDFPATRSLDPLVKRLTRGGARLMHVGACDYTPSEELRYVESRLFLAPDRALGAPRTGDVRLSSACGEEAEASRVAAEIQSALDDGVPPDQIAVVYRNVALHAGALRHALTETGIPAQFDVVGPARDTGWGRALVHLTRFALHDARNELLAFIRSPYSGVPRDAAERVEARWRRHGVDRRAALVASMRRDAPAASKLAVAATSLMRGQVTESTAAEWQDMADCLLSSGHRAHGVTGELSAEGRADVAAHRALLGLVEEAAGLSRVRTSGPELMDAFLQAKATITPAAGRSAVRVLSAERARSHRFQVVIIGGLSFGDFPPRASENPLRAPSLVSALGSMGLALPSRDEEDAERLTFYLVASRATKRLVLSRQVAASDGSELRPSWLLEEFLDLYRVPGAEDIAEEQLPPVFSLGFEQTDAGAAPRSLRRSLRAAARDGATLSSESAMSRVARASRRAAAREPVLRDERVLQELRGRTVYSATEIEAYLRCPYAWFHERVVRARPLEEDHDALEVGRLSHEALRRLFQELPAAVGDVRVTEHNVTRAVALAAEVVDALVAGQGDATSLAERSVQASVHRKVVGFVRADAGFLPDFTPVAHEMQFAPEEKLFEGFQLAGRMDRVDQGPNGELLVADYKTGTVDARYSASKSAERGLLQLALYARIAQKCFGAPIAGGLYRRLSSQNVTSAENRGFYSTSSVRGRGLVSTDGMESERIDVVIRDAEARARQAVEGMREGLIPPTPLDVSSCDRCRLRGFCPGGQR